MTRLPLRAQIPETPPTPFSSTAIIPASLKSVLLHDWWLIKAKGKGLAVGGFFSREGRGVRVFSSTAISKRRTATLLETEDGIMVTVSGFLNRTRTHRNGFPSELYNRFIHGFPYDWEEYAAVVVGEDSADICASMRNSAYEKFKMTSGNNESNLFPFSLDDLSATKITFPFSLDDLSATKARDLLLLSFGDSDYCSLVKNILSDKLKTSRDVAFARTESPINLNMDSSCPGENVDSGTETPTEHKMVTVPEDNKESSRKSMSGQFDPASTEGISTRSMTGKRVTMSVSTRSMTRSKCSHQLFNWRGYREKSEG